MATETSNPYAGRPDDIVLLWARVPKNDRPQFITAFHDSAFETMDADDERLRDAQEWFEGYCDPGERVEYFTTRAVVRIPAFPSDDELLEVRAA